MSVTEDTAAAAPTPVLAGTFAIYHDGDGGFVLVTDTGEGPQRKHIPAAIIKLAARTGAIGKFFS